jgi:ribonuclease VapC
VIIDTSAIIAILRKESDAGSLTAKALRAESVRISAATLVEARIVAQRDGGQAELEELMQVLHAEVVPLDAA